MANLGLYAYDLKGKQVWTTPLEANPIYLDFGTGASPALHGNQLIIVNDNEKQQFIASFDKKTGKQIWRTNRDIVSKGGQGPQRSGWATPFIWAHKQRTEIVTIGPADAVSYDLDGKELWRLSGMAATPIPSPFSYDGLLISTAAAAVRCTRSGRAPPATFRCAKGRPRTTYVAWSVPRAGTYLPSPVAYEGGVYALTETGILSRYDAKTGKLELTSRGSTLRRGTSRRRRGPTTARSSA